MSLREYKRKRHFNRTPEPAGKEGPQVGRSYVVQKHAASHLHYDFRLELDGVLKSWAVPKGPSVDPAVKRLAMQVEDHPVEYGSFEGTIPAGEYGGGTVMLWDQGEWEPVGDPHEGYRAGKLKFKLHGQKLHGDWMLLRTGKGHSAKEQRQWLLFKERDDEARPAQDGDVLEEMPLSASTGRTLEDIAAGRAGALKAKAKSQKKPHPRPAPKATDGKFPSQVDVELATLVKEAPEGDDWLHEIKFDGYRILCQINEGQVEFISRNHKNWTGRFRFLVEAVKALPVKQAILDGEVVALRKDGVSDFQELQNAFRGQRADALYYYLFDLLYLDGEDLRTLPLDERKRRLAQLLKVKNLPPRIRLSEHIEGNGRAFFKQACQMGLEGIISKRRDQPYEPGRNDTWLKVKCTQHDEFVIAGYTDPEGSRSSFGALLLGYYNKKRELVYAGKVGTGFDAHRLRDLLKQLESLQQKESPFSDRKSAPAGVHWVGPKLVAQVAFGAWTRDGILRHASFQGLREDKPATEITRDKAKPLATVVKKGKAMNRSVPANGSVRNGRTSQRSANDYDAHTQELAGVRLTSPDKVLYPGQGITKLELANYYRAIADWILPYLKDRPLVLVRCPEGCDKACFFQKHPAIGTPASLRQIPVQEKTQIEQYVVVDDVAGLISLAQIGALEIHAWGSRADKLEQPDRLVFDLDPDTEVPWKNVVQGARQIRQFLQELGLESFVKTTGGKGLHLVVPIDRRHDWDEVKAFCKEVADLIATADPAHFTVNMAKVARPGKIYLDYLRNDRGATAVVPYSTRARPNAPISTPLTWKELSPRIHSDHYTLRNIEQRLASRARDPWQGIESARQGLAAAIKKLRQLSLS